jgi:hypothetical protein
MPIRLRALRGVLAVALLLGGCGLISSDITKVTFDLPDQTYSFDTSKWVNLPPAAAGQTFPSIQCSADSDCCTLGQAVQINCSTTPLVCASNACNADLPESQYTAVNLAMQVPALATFPGHSLVNVSVASVTYKVTSNTLNVDVPAIQVYLAPDGVTDPHADGAVLFGTLPVIPAGSTPTGAMTKAPGADAAFQMFTKNVSTTFNIIAATTVVIAPGTPVPHGAITVTVGGAVSAQL